MPARIRLATESDAAQILEIYAPVVRDTAISFEEEPPSVAEMQQRIRQVMKLLPWFVCDVNGRVAGYACASPFKARGGYRWACELTVYVHPEFHRCGIARSLYAALLPCLAAQGYRVAVAVITIPNPGSIGLHEAIGMRRVGTFENIGHKHGQWWDDGVWQLELAPLSNDPKPPSTHHELVGSPVWENALDTASRLLRIHPGT